MTSDALDQPFAIVHRTAEGEACRVEIDGRSWNVVGQPVRWYERRPNWWEHTTRLPRGTGKGVIDFEVLQVEARLGSTRSDTQTFQLVQSIDGTYRVRDILRAA